MEKYLAIFKDLPLPALILSKDGSSVEINDSFNRCFHGDNYAKVLDFLNDEIYKF